MTSIPQGRRAEPDRAHQFALGRGLFSSQAPVVTGEIEAQDLCACSGGGGGGWIPHTTLGTGMQWTLRGAQSGNLPAGGGLAEPREGAGGAGVPRRGWLGKGPSLPAVNSPQPLEEASVPHLVWLVGQNELWGQAALKSPASSEAAVMETRAPNPRAHPHWVTEGPCRLPYQELCLPHPAPLLREVRPIHAGHRCAGQPPRHPTRPGWCPGRAARPHPRPERHQLDAGRHPAGPHRPAPGLLAFPPPAPAPAHVKGWLIGHPESPPEIPLLEGTLLPRPPLASSAAGDFVPCAAHVPCATCSHSQ